jgi:sarcosine oxidase subunit alpha
LLVATKQTELTETSSRRLPTQRNEVIDRLRRIRFTFDGREYRAHPGDTIASALTAAGEQVISRSFKYHRPRGLLCCAGHCPNCIVQVDGEPNVRACRRAVVDGMQVRHQNAWPSLKYDLMSLTQLGERLLPVGFYYKTFIRPRSFWPLYEQVLRHAAGLGEVNHYTPHGDFSQQYLHGDISIIGGGPAGMSAAVSAAERGARVLLFDENPALGGHLRFAGNDMSSKASFHEAVKQQPNITVLTDTTVLGWYLDNWLAAVRDLRLFKIRTSAIVVATGAYEMPLVFDNNDLPGVMLGSAVQRLLNLYGVVPGRRILIVTSNDDGWALAGDLDAAGVTPAAIVDERASSSSSHVQHLAAKGIPIFRQHTIAAARGADAVRGAVIAPVVSGGEIDSTTARVLDCDLIAISMGWAPASELVYEAGGKFAYDEQRGEFMPTALPPGVYVAGRATGTHSVENQLTEGRLAGLSAAAFVGLGRAPADTEYAALEKLRAAEPRPPLARVRVPGKKKQFVCYCEDVTHVDLETAIDEGYDSIELLKRYSTISMGPCQGKMCSLNTIHLCARANSWSIQETGTTTARPPTTPVSLGALAGQHMEPVQLTPIHDWHVARGATMMIAGLGLRPAHYGDVTAEVQAVRERVGLIDVSTLGKFRLAGPGAPILLERIYINQWRNLDSGRVRYGVMCNEEGVVLDDGVCARLSDDEWYMTTTSSGAGAIFEWIQWWVQSGWGDGVHVTDLTEVFAAFNLAGPKARATLQKLTALDLANKAFPYMNVRSADVAGVPCRLFRIGFTGELSYEIHCPAGYGRHVWEALMGAGEEFRILPFGIEAQRVLRLEKGHIIVGQDTDAISDAISADLSWAVKLDKPDFLGKRSLTRVSMEGPRQRLVGFKMARSGIVPEEGLQIVTPSANGKLEIIGYITSSKFSPTLGEAIGLCWLRADLAAREGEQFTIRLNAQQLEEARVHHGPFYDPQGERLRM